MISINVSQTSVEKMLSILEGPEVSRVLSYAVNDTAERARTLLLQRAQQEYVVKKGRFNKALKFDKASPAQPTAILSSNGRAMELIDFKVSPARYATGMDKPSIYRGKVLRKSKMTELQTGNIKAFIAKFKNGHVSVVERVEDAAKRKPKSSLGNRYLRKLLSPSIPQMIGNEDKVYGAVSGDIENMLQESLYRHVNRILGG